MKNALFLLLFLGAFLPNSQAARFYVNAATGNDASTGTTWAQAFQTFQKAIEVANNGDEIWLTGGTYRPTKDFSGQTYPTTQKLFLGFYINESFQIYGRFNGTETSPDQRNSSNPPTILSGDVDGDDLANPAQVASDIQGENSSRLLYMTNLPGISPVRLDDIVVTASHNNGGFLLVNGGPNVTITKCRFTGNFSTSSENQQIGCVQLIGSSGGSCNPKVDNCLFDHNGTSQAPGGCMVWAATGPCNATFTNCTFQDNTGTYAGGMSIFAANGLPCIVNVTNCNFFNNTATANSFGGGISCVDGKLTCTNCVFTNNTAYGGGAIYASEIASDRAMSLINCTFNQNSALYSGGAIYLLEAFASITGGVFNNNTATVDGGGIFTDPYVFQSAFTLACDRVNFTGNSAGNGGGICNRDPFCSVQIKRSKFDNNQAMQGGAFYMDIANAPTANSSIEASLFTANAATQGNGGAIYLQGGAGSPYGLVLRYSTLYNNYCSQNGNQVFANQANFYGTDLISWSTVNSSGAGEFYGNNINVTESMFQAADCATAGIASCTGNVFGRDPLFVDAASGNFHLQKCSSAVNGGSAIGTPTLDYDGNPRPYNDGTGLVDLGAYEYQGPKTGCVTAICKNISVNLNASGMVSVPAGDVNNGSTGGCALTFRINDQATQDYNCHHIGGTQAVTLKVTDCSGTTATCAATITVKDATAPTMLCKPTTINLNASGQATLLTENVNNGSTDNCTLTNLAVSQTNFTCANVGNNTVVLSANDFGGNTASCTAVVTVKDVTAPTLLCKPVTINLSAAGQATLTLAQVNNGSYDNCSISNMTVSQASFTCANVGVNNVVLSGSDPSGNMATCTAAVTVKDVTVPVAKCKSFTASLAPNGTMSVPAISVDNGSTDNCTFALSLTPSTFNCGNLGANVVTLRATDGSSNTATCTGTITVKDVTAPSALCKNATINLNDVGQATLTAAQMNNGSSDACGIVSMTLNKTQFNCGDLGTPQTITLTLKDASNNAASCQATVTAKDNLAPTAVCANVTVHLASNGKVTVNPSSLAENSFDNCSVWSFLPSAKVYTTANLGNNTLVVTVKDFTGNAATCTSIVTVQPYNGATGDINNRDAEVGSVTAVDLQLYPNPTTGTATLTFTLPAEQDFNWQVYDLSGRLVLSETGQGRVGENSVPVVLDGAPAGIYLVVVQSGDWKGQQRLVVQQ